MNEWMNVSTAKVTKIFDDMFEFLHASRV